jgi:hypothetical protein
MKTCFFLGGGQFYFLSSSHGTNFSSSSIFSRHVFVVKMRLKTRFLAILYLFGQVLGYQKDDFDFLVLIQDWPVSDCIDWLSKNNTDCSIKGNFKSHWNYWLIEKNYYCLFSVPKLDYSWNLAK